MRDMTASGELDSLTPERVWKETERALGEDAPDVYIQVLRDCGALDVWFPEISRLFGVPQRPEYHPEVDTGVHTLMSLRVATRLSRKAMCDLPHWCTTWQGRYPAAEWPRWP
jgi:tRNA nucleotidyltransferase (CCA-adding enzyme)